MTNFSLYNSGSIDSYGDKLFILRIMSWLIDQVHWKFVSLDKWSCVGLKNHSDKSFKVKSKTQVSREL